MASAVLLSSAEIARGVAKRWHEQYFDKRKAEWRYGDDKREIYERLAALFNPTPIAVAEIIGNDSWTDLKCNACNRSVDAAVRVGEEPDDESRTAYLCRGCALQAASLFVGGIA